MSDIIATVWDFDKTLIPGYMQAPIFEKWKVDPKSFWNKVNGRIADLRKKGLEVNPDTYYLNELIRESQAGGALDGLNNRLLKELGAKLQFFEGATELFQEINAMNDEEAYQAYGVRFENYIVSTGLKRMIEGSAISPFVKKVWGAELVDDVGSDGTTRLTEVAYSLDNSTKTRALFEINKGVGIEKGGTIDVNSKIPHELRRVQFCNMIYVADGPSDVPAFSVTLQKGGATMAVYPKGNAEAFRQVDELRRNGRVQMVAEADYKKGSSAYLWVMECLKRQANQIIEKKQAAYKLPAGTPRHLI